MDKRSNIAWSILVVAASAARRSALVEISSRALNGRATITSDSHISLERIAASKSGIVVADLDTPASAAAMLHFLEQAPAGTGSVALIDEPDPGWVNAALSCAISAVIARDAGPDELQLALQAADAGLVLLHPPSVRGLTLKNASHNANDITAEELTEELTAREEQVLRLVSIGLGNKEIAACLAISDHTVKFHISSILGKLNAATRTEAVSLGIRKGLIPI